MRAMKTLLGTALAVAGLSLALGGNASAASSCGAKYKAAKAAGTLGGQDYKSFKAAQCASDTSTSAAASPVGKPDRTAATASGPATFPSAIDAKYAKETPGKARFHTCLDQYHANKAANTLGGMKWVSKGGYYSACSKKLKG